MKGRIFLGVALLLATATAGFADDAGEMWTRALAATQGAERWVPAATLMTMEFLNRKGETDGTLRMLTSVTETEEGLVVEMTELERPGGIIGAMMPAGATDGTTSASSRPPADGSQGDESSPGSELFANPFLPDVQESVQIRSTGERREINGIVARGFEIAWVGTDDSAYQGTIWLEADSGRPLLLEATGDSPQPMIRSLAVTVDYAPVGDLVFPTRVVSSMEGQFALVIKFRMRMTFELNDYFETDGESEYIIKGAE